MPRIEDTLAVHATSTPEKVAVIVRGAKTTYRALAERVAARAEQYVAAEQNVVAVVATDSLAFVVDYLAAHIAGKVALVADPSATGTAVLAERYSALALPADSADILCTTGTTGAPKVVVISHRARLANALNLVEGQRYTSALTVIVPGMLHHLGALSKVYTALYAGATVVLLPGMKDPNMLINAIRAADSPVATFLVPTALRMLLHFCRRFLPALDEKLAFIETGADTLFLSDITLLRQLLPTTHLYNTYATTETGIVATYDFKGHALVEGCVGQPLRHCTVSINDHQQIVVSGETLCDGYLCGEAFSPRDATQQTAFTTNDIGFVDSKGLLHLQGRVDDVINVGGIKVLPTAVEHVANSINGVQESICIAQQHPIFGSTLTLLVVPEKGATITPKEIRTHLKEQLPKEQLPATITLVDNIAHTPNGKLRRTHYRP